MGYNLHVDHKVHAGAVSDSGRKEVASSLEAAQAINTGFVDLLVEKPSPNGRSVLRGVA
jgi:hypothetical protein